MVKSPRQKFQKKYAGFTQDCVGDTLRVSKECTVTKKWLSRFGLFTNFILFL